MNIHCRLSSVVVTPGSVIQAVDKPSPDVDVMVGPEVKIPVGMGKLLDDGDIQGAICLLSDVCVEES